MTAFLIEKLNFESSTRNQNNGVGFLEADNDPICFVLTNF